MLLYCYHTFLFVVHSCFKKVTRWKENIRRDGSLGNKVISVIEYVLMRLEKENHRESINHDVGLRKRGLEAKEKKNRFFNIYSRKVSQLYL